jgi:hypothetical protein
MTGSFRPEMIGPSANAIGRSISTSCACLAPVAAPSLGHHHPQETVSLRIAALDISATSFPAACC